MKEINEPILLAWENIATLRRDALRKANEKGFKAFLKELGITPSELTPNVLAQIKGVVTSDANIPNEASVERMRVLLEQ